MSENDNNDGKKRKWLGVVAPGREFILPYIARQLPRYEVVSGNAADLRVEIREPGCGLSHGDAADVPTLVCPNIVGTGMTGFPMEMARRVANGTYYHIEGNEARMSTVHAVDVARAVEIIIGRAPAVYVLTDGANPTYDEFAEALAWRLNQKRILRLKPSWARWIMNRNLRRIITSDSVVPDGERFINEFDFKPNIVTEYLRTHVYDDESL